MKRLMILAAAVAAAFSCEKPSQETPAAPAGELPSSLVATGGEWSEGVEMVPSDDGVWTLYGQFSLGETVSISADGAPWLTVSVPSDKAGICRLRVDGKTKAWSFVNIRSVVLKVTEGSLSGPVSLEAQYEGKGVWTVSGLSVESEALRWRYVLDTDAPEDLRYFLALWDNAGTAPTALTEAYLTPRALGQREYEERYLKDNRACWMVPSDKVGYSADLTLSMNRPSQEITFKRAHKGPKAAFIGDSITWLWGLSSLSRAKSAIVIPMDPLPSYLTLSGDNVLIRFHPEFFSTNNYIDKGISGNNTTEMRARFQRDVLSQDPSVVVIMGGTNDLAQGTSKEKILENISAMAEAADALEMKVILCSVTPCNEVYSRLSNPNTKGAHILALNKMLKEYALGKGFGWCNYHPALAASDGLALRDDYCLYDRLHPNPDAYTVMEGIIQPIIDSLTE